jgi:hypothetical protein
VELVFKTNEIDIKNGEPFANDRLDRKQCADMLNGLVCDCQCPLVIGINGGWGTGKTTFLKMWRQDLQDKGYSTILFNAWNEDYCDDALVALIGRLSDLLQNLEPNKKSKAQKAIKTVRKLGGHFLKNGIPAAIKLATAGLVNLENKEIEKILEDNLSNAVSSVAQEVIKEYENTHNTLSEFKSSLSEFAKTVTGDGKPLILIIDELDRCRPLFAIEVLEKAKHLFDIPGIIFVLGVDKEQLGHSIRSVYGQGMNVDGYLRRFIDIEFLLPPANIMVFCNHLFEKLGLHSYFTLLGGENALSIESHFAALCKCFNLSLRDVEHCAKLLILACKNTKDKTRVFPYLLSVLIILKFTNSKLYCRYVSGEYVCEEIIGYILNQPEGNAFLNTTEGAEIEASLLAASPNDWRHNVSCQAMLKITGKLLSKPQLLPQRYATMSDDNLCKIFQSYQTYSTNDGINKNILGYLSKKIDLSSLMLDYKE